MYFSTFISKTCLGWFVLLLYFVVMDVLLYLRVQNYDVRPFANNTRASPYCSPIPCDLNPICTVTVKAMTLDYPNLYVLSPLASIVDYLLGISHSWMWLTPNAISISHIAVAVIGARYVTRSSLFYRRVGVVLFQIRAWMDDLDGHVARMRLNIKGERSDVGSIGYFVDGVCDGLGCVALIVAVFLLLRRNSNHRNGYELLPIRTLSSSSLSSHSSVSSISFWRSPLYNVLIVGLHFSLTSIAWNRYIYGYQNLLETDISSTISREDLYDRQTVVFRSLSFWAITLAWRIFNFHAIMNYMLLAIFLDRIWDYVRLLWWQLPTVLFLLILVSEFHYTYTYVEILSMNNNLYAFSDP